MCGVKGKNGCREGSERVLRIVSVGFLIGFSKISGGSVL